MNVTIIVIFFSFFSINAQDGVIDKMYKKLAGFYENNKGVVSVRELTAVSRDTQTGEILKNFSAKIERTDYFYKTPEVKAIEYFENGLKQSLKKYDTREIEPVFPIFDKNGTENYILEISGNEIVQGRKCLKIVVTPKKISTRHFKGEIFVDPEKLELVKMKGAPSKLHWAMKEFNFEYLFTTLNGFPVVKSAKVRARIKVAIIVSDNITDYQVHTITNKFF